MPGMGFTDRYLTEDETRELVRSGLASLSLAGKRVLFIIPDGTRTMPMPQFFALFRELLDGKVAALDFLVALGTHPPMDDAALSRLVGVPVVGGRAGNSRIFNHEWADPKTFAMIGEISAAEIAELSGGRLAQPVPVALNRRIFDYDQIIICGPVFPPRSSDSPAATSISFQSSPAPRSSISALAGRADHQLRDHRLGLHAGPRRHRPRRVDGDRTELPALRWWSRLRAWQAFTSARRARGMGTGVGAVGAAAHRLARRTGAPGLSVMPPCMPTSGAAGKGMYKIEPVVADGGEVIIYAPHIREVSFTHGHLIEEIGYHCRDYSSPNPKRFARYPGGVLAHSTHVKGQGRYDAATGIETPRVQVTLATGTEGALPPDQSRLSRSGIDRRGRLVRTRTRGHNGRPARRRDALPPKR